MNKKNNEENIPEPGESLVDTLLNNESQDCTADLLEFGLDSILDGEVYKDVPILSSVIGIARAGLGIRNYLFVKKLIKFICDYNSVSHNFKSNLKEKIEKDDINFKKDIGDHLIAAIESFNQNEKINALAKIFHSYITGEISNSEFLKFSYILDKIDWNDLGHLRNFYIHHFRLSVQITFLSHELNFNQWSNEVIQTFAYVGLVTIDLGEYFPETEPKTIFRSKRSRSGSYKVNNTGKKFLRIIGLLEI